MTGPKGNSRLLSEPKPTRFCMSITLYVLCVFGDVTVLGEALGVMHKGCTALFLCTDLLLTACQPRNRQQGASCRTLKSIDSLFIIYRFILRKICIRVRRIAKIYYWFRNVVFGPSVFPHGTTRFQPDGML
jgi:hypothetical protein